MPHKRRLNVVPDSVIRVSAFVTSDGLAAELLIQCAEKTNLCTAEELLQETRRVLLEKEHLRNRFSYSDANVERFIEALRAKCTVVTSLPDLSEVVNCSIINPRAVGMTPSLG
ncbi:hypothetical protein HYR99_26555 [Candidatus Poribacteria bacterium]|nr:hypothetical protein [Candidatus Poribacteria bacterium]